jgi:hypothetical protein
MKTSLLLFMLIPLLSVANEPNMANLAKSLHLSAGSKAIIQWERVFKSSRKMKKYKIDTLSQKKKNMLKAYLINHAIDSDQPTIAGA